MATGIDNHRDVYRIECRAIVSCRVLGATVPRGASPGSHFDEDPALALSRELLRLDQDNSAPPPPPRRAPPSPAAFRPTAPRSRVA
jgi:hypothetical protein